MYDDKHVKTGPKGMKLRNDDGNDMHIVGKIYWH